MGILLTEDTANIRPCSKHQRTVLPKMSPILPLINTSKAVMNEGDRAPGHSAKGCYDPNSIKSRAYTLQGSAWDTANLDRVVDWECHNPTGATGCGCSSTFTPDLPPRGTARMREHGLPARGLGLGVRVRGGPDAERSRSLPLRFLRVSGSGENGVWVSLGA